MNKKYDIIKENILNNTEEGDYGICSPPMKAQKALDELKRHFLGDDWYSTISQSNEQINTEIVYDIERNFKGNKKAWKKLKDQYKINNKGR